ncbi:hypothetical protein [uncultured Alsobacter sp.]|uniref:hypothetical protein n=1 Tax=uncultured Alsobacter sp. TaxID=1748258 RepID=UPI0025FF934B|nr:hypothetical protein [uncultured Alsobacter sp.]
MTIEENEDWYSEMLPKLSDNVKMHFVPVDHNTRSLSSAREAIDSGKIKKFDIIIIDGHLRKEATALAFEYLKPDGAIILDNAEGYGFYEETFNRECRRIDFFGFAPGVSLRHCTSLIFVGDCFLLRPDIPIPVLELPTQ